MSIRVRFAPSPTGYLHIGGARTALFNWLFARKMKGTFILRIEDTDEVRSTDESVGAILKSMRWLGLDWDEGPDNKNSDAADKGKYGPYYQIKRQSEGFYKKHVDELMSKGLAYKCFCTKEEIDDMRKKAQEAKKNPKYNGQCRDLSEEKIKELEGRGRDYVIRFKMPETGSVVFEDLVKGSVKFENYMLDDFVLCKSSGVPTYSFACVIDDHLMQISHVLRGDDHLSNTPKQVHLYNSFGWDMPEFAHMSMILGPDGSRLSKRHGHTSVLEYRDEGYLPEALVNYLALLGWSTEDSQQIFAPDEMTEKFSVERCSKSAATFDPQKLLWMNGEYMRKLPAGELSKRFYFWVSKKNDVQEKIKGWDRKLVDETIKLEHEKFQLLKDIPGRIDIFFVENVEYMPEAVNKVLKKDTAKMVLEESLKRLENHSGFSAEELEKYARAFAAEKQIGAGKVFHPLRVAVSGRTEGPSLFHMMEVLGKHKVIKRINDCLKKCFN
jgi:glutamyl-tRNA synthetase